MTNTRPQQTPERRNAFTRFLDTVEWLGNFLPHPVTLFAILAVGIVFLSWFLGWIGLAVEDPRPADAHGAAEDGMIRAVSLLNGDGVRMIFTNLVTNFTGFAPFSASPPAASSLDKTGQLRGRAAGDVRTSTAPPTSASGAAQAEGREGKWFWEPGG